MEKEKINENNDNRLIIDSYEPPAIEVVEVFVEKGFANSAKDWDDDTW